MKKLLIVPLLLCNGFLLAQDDNVPVFLNDEPTYRKAPVYEGCETLFNNNEYKACMSEKISELVSKNFNTSVGSKTNLEHRSKVKVDVTFVIDTLGMIQNIMAKAPHPALEEEAVRVVKLIPKMTPGYIDGKPVIVPYSVPISVEIINPKLIKSNATFPVFRGCDESLNYEAQKACTSEKVSDYVKLSFNYELADKLFPTENSTQFQLDFIINEKGVAEQINVKANKREVAIDVINVVKRMPKFKKPGTVNGKPSKTPVTILMTIYFPH